MSTLNQYRQLFTFQLLQEYYLPVETSIYQNIPVDQQAQFIATQQKNYNVFSDFKILPTQESLKLLKNYNLLFKQNNQGFFVAGKVTSLGDGTFTPFISFDAPLSFRFTLELKNSKLYNFSNIRLERNLDRKDYFLYYFSNRENNPGAGSIKYATQPVPDFSDTYSYEAGEVIIDRTNPLNPVMFEALEDNGPGAFNSSNWMQIYTDQDPLPQFITHLDRMVVRPDIFKHNVAPAASENLTILVRDRDGIIVQTTEFTSSELSTNLIECELNLITLPSAVYDLEVQDSQGTSFPDLHLRFYKDNTIFQNRPFALIECFHEPDSSLGIYRVVDNDNSNRLLSPVYSINLKNRSTFWRYHFSQAPIFTSSQVEVFETSPGNPLTRILVSNQPLGLTQLTRQVEIDVNGESVLLPNPGVASIYPEGGRIYSEINMGGGLGPLS